MPRKKNFASDFVPQDYFDIVLDFYGISAKLFPWRQNWMDLTVERKVPWMVHDFYIPEIEGQKTCQLVIVYKSTVSSHTCTKRAFMFTPKDPNDLPSLKPMQHQRKR